MPVSRTPTAPAPAVAATDVNVTSIPGTWCCDGGGIRVVTSKPSWTSRLRPLGAIDTVPGSNGRPLTATDTGSAETVFNQPASPSMKPCAMCWTTRTAASNVDGSSPSTAATAWGPPVDAPTTINETVRLSSAAGDGATAPSSGSAVTAGAEAANRCVDMVAGGPPR